MQGIDGDSARWAVVESSIEIRNWRAEGLEETAGQSGDIRTLISVKLLNRAAEKAARCYGGDASRLLDVCCALDSIRRPADLARFLPAVMEDHDEIFIVLVKEMPLSDAAATRGFRITNS